MRRWHLQPGISLALVIAASLFGTGAPAWAGYVATQLGASPSPILGAAEAVPVLGAEDGLDAVPVLDGAEDAPASARRERSSFPVPGAPGQGSGLTHGPAGMAGSPDSGPAGGTSAQPLCILPRPLVPAAEAVGVLMARGHCDRLSPFAARVFRPPRGTAWGPCAA